MRKNKEVSTPESAKVEVRHVVVLRYVNYVINPKQDIADLANILNKHFNKVANDYAKHDVVKNGVYLKFIDRDEMKVLADTFAENGYKLEEVFDESGINALSYYLNELVENLLYEKGNLKPIDEELQFFYDATLFSIDGEINLDHSICDFGKFSRPTLADATNEAYQRCCSVAMKFLIDNFIIDDPDYLSNREDESDDGWFGDFVNVYGSNVCVPSVLDNDLTLKYLNMVFDNIVEELAPSIYKQMIDQMCEKFKQKYKIQNLSGKITINDDTLIEEVWRLQFDKLKEQKLIGDEFENWRDCYDSKTSKQLFNLSKQVTTLIISNLVVGKKKYKESVVNGEEHISLFSIANIGDFDECYEVFEFGKENVESEYNKDRTQWFVNKLFESPKF